MAIKQINIGRLIITLLFVFLALPSWTQQKPIYTMYEFARTGVNPAYTGKEGIYDMVLLSRQQWTGFAGAPKSYYLAAHSPLRSQKAGVGFDFQRNIIGPTVQNGIFLSYAYTIMIAEMTSLSFGLRGGLNSYQIGYNDLLIIDPGDPLFETNPQNILLPNVGTGIHFEFRNYYVDFSVPLLLRNEFSPDKESGSGLENKEERLYNIQTGASYQVADGVILQPALALWLTGGAPALIDIRVSAILKDAAGIGLVYRISGSFGGYVSYKVTDSFILGYAYELPLSYNYQLTSGTHEVVLGFDFQFLKRKTQSPRRF
jgi:type IX secretion system PorP/SprF family membrane protein